MIGDLFFGDFDSRGMPHRIENPGSDTVSYSVSASRGVEQKAVKAIGKALNDLDINFKIAGFFVANELSSVIQNRLMQFFLASVRGWCDIYDTGIVDPAKDKNFNTMVVAAIIRDALIARGLWED